MLSQNNNSSVISNMGDVLLLKKLIISAKNGDSDAFSEVYKKLFTPLYRYTLSRCHDIELTKDICQQTFLKFYESLHTYEPEKSPLAYLFTIAKRLLINHHEKKSFTSIDESTLETLTDESSSLLDESYVRLLSESINDYLPHLSQDEQEVIRLYYLAEFTYTEISETMWKEEVYLRKLKERALKKLRVLTKHLYEGN